MLRDGGEATEEELQEFAKAQIAGYKVPKSVEFRTEPLPLSGGYEDPQARGCASPYWEGSDRRRQLVGWLAGSLR